MGHAMSPLPLAWTVAVVLAMGSCGVLRHIDYDVDPGVSASFNPTQLAASVAYAKTFCSVLAAEFAQGGWGPCGDYLRIPPPAPRPEPLDDIPTEWTLLRLGGFGAQCLAPKVTTFEDAAKHLGHVHHIRSHHVDLGGFESSEQNADRILAFVRKLPEPKRLIVIAHSKGAADVMVALQQYPQELRSIEAVITIAGAVGGSYLVDRLQRLNDQVLQKLDLPCDPPESFRMANAIDSMRRGNRQKFLAEHNPPEHVLGYSISAVSTRDRTSKILHGFWAHISFYAKEHDTHIVERESILPWGTFLGRALGDHWAVAMPFDPNPKVSDRARRVIDQNKFPREALVEAAVRTAIDDLRRR